MRTAGRIVLALVTLAAWAFGPGAVAQSDSASGGAAAVAVPASRQADDVVIITLRGEIDRWSELSIKRRLKQAEESGADAVVVEIDSPGGEVGAVLEICNALKASPIPNTVAWIHPDAYSGGAIVALACRQIVTSSPASMGDAFPVTFGPQGVRGLTPDERTKFLPPLLTEVADSARRHGYDEFLVQAMVVDQIELWSVRDRVTGERWLINEAEYRMLFEGEPVRGKPVLTGITGGRASQRVDQAAAPADAEVAEHAEEAVGGDGVEPAGEDAADQAAAEPPAESVGDAADADPEDADPAESPFFRPGGVDEETAFTPASPAVADLTESISSNLQASSVRPNFTPADRGRFVDPVYVSDGSGPVVLRDDQLREFGISSAIIQNDAELQAYFGAKRMIRTEQTWSETMVRFMMHPVVRGLLIVTLLVGLFIEMSSPGMVLPGALAIGALVGIVAPPMLVGMAGWWEIAALGVGVLCLLVELLVIPGFGLFGVIGLVALFAGLVGTFIPDGSGGLFGGNRAAQTGLFYGVATVLLATVTAGVAIYFLARNFGTVPILSRLVLDGTREDAEDAIAVMEPVSADEPEVGAVGVALTPLRPSGRVNVGGRLIDATASRAFIEAGERVELVRRQSFDWVVRPLPGGTEPNGEERRA